MVFGFCLLLSHVFMFISPLFSLLKSQSLRDGSEFLNQNPFMPSLPSVFLCDIWCGPKVVTQKENTERGLEVRKIYQQKLQRILSSIGSRTTVLLLLLRAATPVLGYYYASNIVMPASFGLTTIFFEFCSELFQLYVRFSAYFESL